MSLVKAKELREKRAALIADAQKLITKEGVTKEDREKFDAMMNDAEVMKGDFERIERAAALEVETRQSIAHNTTQPGAENASAADVEARTKLVRAHFRTYLKEGRSAARQFQANTPELRTYTPMNEGTGSQGGYFVPQGFQYEIETALKAWGGMREVSRILETATGNQLPFPTSNDTTNSGEIVGENQSVSQTNATIGHIMFGAYKYSTKMVQVSLELLQDSAFDIESYLKDQFVIRLGRATNAHFTNGSGSGQPTGIVTAAAADSNEVTSANAGVIGVNDLIELEHSVDPSYRKGAKFMFHDTTLKAIKELKDSLGRPLFMPGYNVGASDTILGYGYQINQDMPQIASSNNALAFGDLSKYLIRVVKELRVLRLDERYADQGMVAFIGFARYDGNLVDAGTHPVNLLTIQ